MPSATLGCPRLPTRFHLDKAEVAGSSPASSIPVTLRIRRFHEGALVSVLLVVVGMSVSIVHAYIVDWTLPTAAFDGFRVHGRD